MPFYCVSIPPPNIEVYPLNQLAQIKTGRDTIEVFWWPEKRKPVFRMLDSWFIQPDANICLSLASLLGWDVNTLIFRDLYMFENGAYVHGHAATESDSRNIKFCEWSDYAIDYMAFQARVEQIRSDTVVD